MSDAAPLDGSAIGAPVAPAELNSDVAAAPAASSAVDGEAASKGLTITPEGATAQCLDAAMELRCVLWGFKHARGGSARGLHCARACFARSHGSSPVLFLRSPPKLCATVCSTPSGCLAWTASTQRPRTFWATCCSHRACPLSNVGALGRVGGAAWLTSPPNPRPSHPCGAQLGALRRAGARDCPCVLQLRRRAACRLRGEQ